MDRFWQRVNVGDVDECWDWTLSVGSHGYGQWWPRKGSGDPFMDRNWTVHRLAYTLAKGEIPSDMTVDHICHNRRCCNPQHLQLLTNLDNARKNRASERRKPKHRKKRVIMTEAQEEQVRDLLDKGQMGTRTIAKVVGVSRSTVMRRNRRSLR